MSEQDKLDAIMRQLRLATELGCRLGIRHLTAVAIAAHNRIQRASHRRATDPDMIQGWTVREPSGEWVQDNGVTRWKEI